MRTHFKLVVIAEDDQGNELESHTHHWLAPFVEHETSLIDVMYSKEGSLPNHVQDWLVDNDWVPALTGARP